MFLIYYTQATYIQLLQCVWEQADTEYVCDTGTQYVTGSTVKGEFNRTLDGFRLIGAHTVKG